MTKNFNQYDATVDKLENVEAGAKTLRKDLEASVSKYLASRQKNKESIQQFLTTKTELTKMKDKARDAEGKIHSLNITIKKERKEKELVETQIRDVISEKMVAEETIQGLQLKVIQLEITLSKKHCKVHSELAVTTGHKSEKDGIKKNQG